MNNPNIAKPSADFSSAFTRLVDIVKVLRGPDGCPWDREQTPDTIGPQLIEEVYEYIDAQKENDKENMKEELGDLFLLVTMLSYMNEEKNDFTIVDVLNEISEKLLRRHPHVFGDAKADNSDQVLDLWNYIKTDVEGKRKKDSILDSVPKSLPPLERAFELQKKASKVGFDWTESHDVWLKVLEELQELKSAYETGDTDKALEEFGDFIFSIVNICRFLSFNPGIALNMTNKKFIRRFHYVENIMKTQGEEISEKNFNLMDSLWNEAKEIEKKRTIE